jgi:hypothetical protein
MQLGILSSTVEPRMYFFWLSLISVLAAFLGVRIAWWRAEILCLVWFSWSTGCASCPDGCISIPIPARWQKRSSQALVYPTTLDSEFGEGVQLDQLENWKPEVNISHWTPKSRGSWGWVKTYEIPIFWSINIKSFPAILGTLPYFT